MKPIEKLKSCIVPIYYFVEISKLLDDIVSYWPNTHEKKRKKKESQQNPNSISYMHNTYNK